MKLLKFISLSLVFSVFLSVCSFAADIDINAKAALLIDSESGQVVYSKNADEKLYPASITKLMTALIVAEENDLSETITVTASALENLSAAGSSVGLKKGEKITVDNLLICLLVASANEAANILAEHNAGSVDAFIEKMNKKAEELGLKSTHFVNAHGLHDDDHYTCASDVAIIARRVMQNKRLSEIVAIEKATIPATNLEEERLFFNTNSMLSPYKERTYLYKYTTGIKTGHTTPAGLCLAASATKGDSSFIAVVLGASYGENKEKGHFIETTKLFKWGFENFEKKTLLSKTTPVSEIKVRLAWDRDHIIASPKADFACLVPTDYNPEKLELVKTIPETLDAPIAKGDKLGTVKLVYDGAELGEIDIVAIDDVDRSIILYVWDLLTSLLGTTIAKIVLILLGAFIIFYLFYIVRFNSRRRNSRRYRGSRRRR